MRLVLLLRCQLFYLSSPKGIRFCCCRCLFAVPRLSRFIIPQANLLLHNPHLQIKHSDTQ